MHKISKQIFKGEVTHIMSILMSFIKTTVFMFAFLPFLTFKFSFHYSFLYFGTLFSIWET